MSAWLPAALGALLCFGLWGFFPKLAVAYLDHRSALVYQTLGSLLLGLVVLFSLKLSPAYHPRGALFAFLTGLAGVGGTFFYLAAAERGKISLVVSITALYPLITIILAHHFLKEPLTLKHLAGLACALVAILLLST